MLDELKEYFDNGLTVYPVHRLDKSVGGVMVYALTKSAAGELSRQVQERTIGKEYFAIVHGQPETKSGVMRDLLFKDSGKNKAYVVKRARRGVKQACLEYSTVFTLNDRTLVRVALGTGRFHQIRVQFASRKMPLVGDGKYGAKDNCQIALWSCSVSFHHPVSGQPMTFFARPEGEVWQEFAPYITEE
jgi:23S rRNA pseudouridine1911/1915/1917 synthase